MSGIKDVARKAAVSTATVSHVINNTRFVSDAVRERVVGAISACGYYPNSHARSLASGRSNSFGLMVSDISNPFFPEIVKAVEAAAFEKGYDIILSNTDYDATRTAHYVRRLIERKVAGVVLMTTEFDCKSINELATRGVPVVFLDAGKPAGLLTSNLRVDYETGIAAAFRHLVALGHSDIAFISGPPDVRSAELRLRAFEHVRQQFFPEARDNIFVGDFKIEGGRRTASAILAAGNAPTVVLAANDLMAFGAIQEFKSAGLSVPAEISIIGFDDIKFSALTEPALTTVRIERDELGKRAGEALVQALANPKVPGAEITVPTELIVRNSTMCRRANKQI